MSNTGILWRNEALPTFSEGIRGLSVERSHFELLVQKAPNARLTSLPGNRSGMKRDEMEALIDSVLEFIDGLVPNGVNQ